MGQNYRQLSLKEQIKIARLRQLGLFVMSGRCRDQVQSHDGEAGVRCNSRVTRA